MGGGVDLDCRCDHDMVADMYLIVVQNGTHPIQIDMIADVDVVAVAAVEGGLYERTLTDLTQQLLENGPSFRYGFRQIIAAEQFLGPPTLGFQVRIKAVVDVSSQHLLLFGS
jgi:hypothetical protein